MTDDILPTLTGDERAAMRAFLQRSDVRLSTVHRVATALLSGAGLMVLLPAVARDSVVEVVYALVKGDLDAVHLILVAAVVVVLALPIVALWTLLRDLTRFYFHANHITHDGGETFAPRFTLTALRLPADELGDDAAEALDLARSDPRAVELLVPANDASRDRVDRQLAAYRLQPDDEPTDAARAEALFRLTAARPRTLAEEVAKVEAGMVRHILRVQVVVLRYVKALLALLTTAIAVFAAAAVVQSSAVVTPSDEVWLAAIVMIWAPGIVVAVMSPVRWLERLLRNEGATHTAVAEDPELTLVERISIRLALLGWSLAFVALIAGLAHDSVTTHGRIAGALVAVGTFLALVAVLASWGGRARLLRR